MTAVWTVILTHLAKNWEAYGIFAAGIGTAAVTTWPVKFPGLSAQAWWSWARDAFQTALPARRQPQPAAPTTFSQLTESEQQPAAVKET